MTRWVHLQTTSEGELHSFWHCLRRSPGRDFGPSVLLLLDPVATGLLAGVVAYALTDPKNLQIRSGFSTVFIFYAV